MSNIIEFKIVPGDQGLHEDFLMRIPSLNKEFFFDTYYFWDGEYDTDDYKILIPEIESYLTKCKNSILKLKERESIYIPIDFSDQYYGTFKVTFQSNNTYEFTYGSVGKTLDTFFLENDDTTSLDIGNTYFDEDFTFAMQRNDVIDNFILRNCIS